VSFRFCLRILFSKWSKSHKFLKFFDRRNKPKVKKKKKKWGGRLNCEICGIRLNRAANYGPLSFDLRSEDAVCLSLQNANPNSILAAKAKTKLSHFFV